MLAVSITANVAQAGAVLESFSDDGIIDDQGAANETTLAQAVSGLTWGGYIGTYGGTKTLNQVWVKSNYLQFDKFPVNTTAGSYAYTEFPSLDMRNGAKLKFMAEENTMADAEVSILLQAGGVWYVSDSPVIVNDTVGGDGVKVLYTFDPATATWDSLGAGTNATIYSMADSDEAVLVPDGVTGIILSTELEFVTGGGFLLQVVEEKDNIQIDDIVWNQDPTINAAPIVKVGNNHKQNISGTPYVYDMPQTLVGWIEVDDLVPAAATSSWALTSATAAVPAPVFWKTDGIGGPRFDASGDLDPNVALPIGVFVMHLDATDGVLEADPNATITRTVVSNKTFSNLDAGDPQSAALSAGGTVTLAGSITDDGYGVITSKWLVESGPGGGGVAFGDDTSLSSTATFSGAAGVYTLRLQAHENAMDITDAKDANDLVEITVYEHQVVILDAPLLDDTYIRGGSSNKNLNFGAATTMRTRGGTGGKDVKALVKFDTSSVVGTVKAATLSLVGQDGMKTFDIVVNAVTYGPNGEWFEGYDTGTIDPWTDDPNGITYNNSDLVIGAEVARDIGLGSNNRKDLALSALVQTPDGKTTLRINTEQDGGQKDFYTKEDSAANAARLTVVYDPNGMYDPSPADGAVGVDPAIAEFSWKALKGTNFEAFFGPTGGAIVSIGTAARIGDTVTVAYVGPELATSTNYTWYVIGDDGATPGPEWTFASVDLPINVTPVDGSVVTPGDTDEDSLTWTGGDTATTTDLYIGTDPVAVAAGASGLLIADIAQGYRPDLALSGDIDYGGSTSTYYWKLVANTPSGVLEGAVTSFDVDNKSRIENFTNVTVGSIVGENATWAASGSTSLENSVVLINGNIDKEPTDDSGATAQSLKLVYNEPNGLTAVTATFSHLQDWSVAGSNTAAMLLQFHGAPGNDDPGVLTITLLDDNDVNAVLTLTPGVDQLDDWDEYLWTGFHNVDISLDDFVGSADRSAIKSMTISIGDGAGTESGAVYFDQFQLYSTRCLTRSVDFYFNNSDCAADVNEVAALAERWLLDGTPVTITGVAPAAIPKIHFTYDGASFDGVGTFTGVYSHITKKTGGANPTQVADFPTLPGGAFNTHSMHVNHDTASDSKMETTAFSWSPNNNASVSVWVKGDPVTDVLDNRGRLDTRRIFQMKALGSGSYWRLEVDNGGRIEAGGGGIETIGLREDPSLLEGNWTHIAYVHDYDNNRNSIYVNGILREHKTAPNPFPATITNLRIPNTGSKSYGGLIDEFHMYDYALSAEEVVYLSNNVSVVSPRDALDSGAGDLNDDGKWDITDLALLGANYQNNNILFP